MKNKIDHDMTENELLYKLLSEKVGAVNPFDVFYFKEGQNSAGQRVITYHLGGKKINENQANTLRAEARMFKETYLFKVICETLSHQAKLQMFEKMQTLDDQHYGKALLHSIGVIENIVNSLDTMPGPTNLSTGLGKKT